jgi:hypothetical protein
MIEVRMQGGDDDCVMLVLEIGELLRQQASVMIVDEGDRAHHKRIAGDNDRADKPIADQIAKRLRAVLIALVGYERIKPMQ